jgi:hypothetical protein
LTDNEALAQGSHTYAVVYAQNCNLQANSNTTLTITFVRQDYMTLRTPDRIHIAANLDYFRLGPDTWFASQGATNRTEYTLGFGSDAFTINSRAVDANGNVFMECRIDWVRLSS